MNIVIAPDSFKGSISAKDLCSVLKRGITRIVPDARVVELPLADGGEGTMENLVYSSQGEIVQTTVSDPLGRPIAASYGIINGKTAVIEMAQASGLPLLKDEEKNPFITSSYGTGELIKNALEGGYRDFIICLGGSATNDGGMGMLKALGIQFFDNQGRHLSEGGIALLKLASYDYSGLDPRIAESSFTIASDVINPLCGPQGASAVFGPQKGATAEMVKELDKALGQFAVVIFKQKRIDIRDLPGSGAAGGMGAALLAFLNARMQSGIEVVMDAINFREKVKSADLVITGEGRLDSQTLSGKVIAGVCKEAGKVAKPVIALCGKLELSNQQMETLGLKAGFSLVSGPCTLEDSMRKAEEFAEERIQSIISLILLGAQNSFIKKIEVMG
ncbi:glycerate kinase [Bacillus sp. M6-12]|uniref:glycerate kinase n=1 Tax=Bacillus sp. M6-12 TaxID=2054166 RepID=UPI000C7831AE|nr:glycerate kinase [Bacillus sp. M6-12]PLS17348.1 glycerate kinase [Bacillus sp. M6-12]